MNTDEATVRTRSGKMVAIILISVVTVVGIGAFVVSKNMPMKSKTPKDPAFTQLERLNAELKALVQALPSESAEADLASRALAHSQLSPSERAELCAFLEDSNAPRPSGAHAQLLVNIEGARQKGAETLEQVHTVRARIEESGQTMDVLVKEVKRDGRLVRDDPYAQPVAKDEAARQRREIDGARARSDTHVKTLLRTVSDIESRHRAALNTLEAHIKTVCSPAQAAPNQFESP